MEEGREAKTSLTDTTIHVSEAIVRFYCLTSATWSVSEEKSFLEPVSGARHRRAAHGSLDGSQLNLVPFEPSVPKQSSLPAVVEHCEICMSECDVEVRCDESCVLLLCVRCVLIGVSSFPADP